ncbi:putative repeat protein (TIGR03806 family) [Algoriphagus boseongensis]|uniref:Putative repeat protein (TIGR03806 family) n=1 Tax=Algoriphagus boseongensis TaxID=1442587 RepID=A0A4R6T5S2_9BACT|nr:SO2930 family diheme c-type cytochrome [Algoriphagus boseongensis]TDQ15017.1 putative repeat protein (TIGR03806 family) [Algoriphagus boseongensis]
MRRILLGIGTLLIFSAGFLSCQKAEVEKEKAPSRALAPEEATGEYPYRRLSTYGFFEGEMNLLSPSEEIIYYNPASSLFTDYAWKSRFIHFPEGTKANLVDGELEFPVGTILIKNFYYPTDFRKPENGRRIIETRLMIHETKGWQAYPYLWNEEQTDAVLKIVGAETEVSFIDYNGKEQVINYLVPNKNQCKSCHNKNEALAPIGVQIKHLNNTLDYGMEMENQLVHWAKLEKLEGFDSPENHPSLINYEDKGQALDERAKAYLDINCSHCHRAEGPASTSGLFLTYDEKEPLKLGVNKTPVAAGKGAGSFKYDIVPGKADESILTHRMNSTEIGVAMPELGRTSIHKEGVELIREWINSMEKSK